VLNIGLARLHGYDVARKIREQPWGKNMVLSMMARSTDEPLEREHCQTVWQCSERHQEYMALGWSRLTVS